MNSSDSVRAHRRVNGDATLARVRAPTLLIVGGADGPVIELNESALDPMVCVKELRIVEGASHLFEEPGALEKVAAMAREWFVRWCARKSPTDER